MLLNSRKMILFLETEHLQYTWRSRHSLTAHTIMVILIHLMVAPIMSLRKSATETLWENGCLFTWDSIGDWKKPMVMWDTWEELIVSNSQIWTIMFQTNSTYMLETIELSLNSLEQCRTGTCIWDKVPIQPNLKNWLKAGLMIHNYKKELYLPC